MWNFAWRNLLTRPLRTILALIGLSVPILGVLGLFSVSGGLRNLIGDTLSQIQGVVVLRENSPSPVFSSLEPELEEMLREVPGVRAVAPEVWGLPPTIEGTSLISRALKGAMRPKNQRMQSMFDAIVLCGQDLPTHEGLKSAVFPRNIVEGRFLSMDDIGKKRVVISRKIARDLADGGKPKGVGDSIRIGADDDAESYEVIGLYDTGSMFLDVVIVTDADTARKILKLGPDAISSIYVESEDPSQITEVAEAIEARVSGVDARSMDEFAVNFTQLLGQLDKFLFLIVSLALLVGVVGIINTMLMSTTERFSEFGVLRTNGWSQGDVLRLVTLESAFLGLLAGLVGCGVAILGAVIANFTLKSSGLQLLVTPGLIGLGLGLSVVMGVLGGLYPAWRAARMVPMEAIRLGSR